MDTLRAAQPKIRQVIAARFFNKSRQPTLQEVADVMGITRERVRQLENTGLAMLRIALTGGQMELHHGRTVEGTKKNLTCTPSRDKLIRALKGETGRTDMVRRAVIALAFEGTPITKKNIRRVLESYPDQGTSGDKNGSIRYVLRTLKKKGLLERRKKNPG
jgi:hypothetical protein